IFDILGNPKKVFGLGLIVHTVNGPGIGRVHGIDKDNIRYVQYGKWIVLDAIGLYWVTLIVDLQYFGPGIGYVHPDGCRPRSPVEGDDQGALGNITNIRSSVIGEKESGYDLSLIVPNGLFARGRLVFYQFSLDVDLTLGTHR